MRKHVKPRRPFKRRTIKTAIICDPMGCMDTTREEEIAAHVKALNRVFRGVGLVRVETPMCVLDSLEAELVLFDFGGMMPGNDLMADNSRRLIRWAADHPSSLVIVASSFTYRHGVLPEMRELGFFTRGNEEHERADVYERPVTTELFNVLASDGWFDDAFEKKVRDWFAAH